MFITNIVTIVCTGIVSVVLMSVYDNFKGADNSAEEKGEY